MCTPQVALFYQPEILFALCMNEDIYLQYTQYTHTHIHMHIYIYIYIYMCVCVCESVNEATRNGCQSAWEERLVLFARYLFNFFHDSRLHVLAEPRETLPSLPEQTKGLSVYVCVCVRVYACAYTLLCCCASKCVSVCDSEYVVCFRQMCETWIWIFFLQFVSTVSASVNTHPIYILHTHTHTHLRCIPAVPHHLNT